MTPRQQTLISESWTQVGPIADQAATIFYARLFELDPSLRPMFAHTDMAAQRKNLVQTLTVVVKSIDRLDTIVPAVEALGRRHVAYGVRPQHFATVGQALLDTLAVGLGDAFTPEVRRAWAMAYGILAGVMQGAMQEERAAAA
ncbi:MAG TPA: globin family protein [Candidatus Limnocylindrales bacterium]|nr:globin family protein [Candidatus Limnocylindrales bacterium]